MHFTVKSQKNKILLYEEESDRIAVLKYENGEKFRWSAFYLGYADTVIWRTAFLGKPVDVVQVMFYKVLTALILGVIFGWLRYKNKNIWSAMLAHTLVNTMG